MEVYNIAYVVILLIILVLSLVQAFLVFIIQPQEESSKPDEKPEKVMKIFSITAGSFALLFWTLIFRLTFQYSSLPHQASSPPSFSK